MLPGAGDGAKEFRMAICAMVERCYAALRAGVTGVLSYGLVPVLG
jgi:hypothetical protein